MAMVETDLARDVTIIMREETGALKDEYRDQVTSAGLGPRLARTWQADVYPKGEASINPAGYIYSKAPRIVQSYVDGATIRPVNGAKWLWIPSKNVPPRRRSGGYASSLGRRSAGSKMTPEEVELHFNAELDVAIEGGKGFAFIDVVSGLSGGYRQATKGRVAGRRGMAPRKAKPVLMFTLVKSVRKPKLLDLVGPAQRAADRVARRLQAKWG
ncbi:MAG: hypothetical protein C0494_16940 [Sphingobium sp.]|nr:hypothetical protein [Sphingobium sp.]